MDKIFSARLDESVIRTISIIARKLKTTKKAIIEAAIKTYLEKVQSEQMPDLLETTHGAWKRTESPEKIIEHTRKVFKKSMTRHQG